MPRCDDCANKRCSCVIVDGDNTEVLGVGSKDDPFRINVDVDGAGGTRLVGEIIMHGGGVAPAGWLICNGAAVDRTTYVNLFTVLGTDYGAGDGSTTFNLPDLAGRGPFGADGSHPRGSVGGQENITLAAVNLPAHVHTIAHVHAIPHTHGMSHVHGMDHAHGNSGAAGGHKHTVGQSNSTGANNNNFARGGSNDRDVDTSTEAAHAHSTAAFAGNTSGDTTFGVTGASSAPNTAASSAPNSGSVGSGQAHTNMPPYSAVTFLIKT